VPLLIVQTNELMPELRFVTPDAGLAGAVATPLPAIVTHAPDPITGAFAASVAVAAHTS